MESQEIIEAAKKRLPVVYDGVVYKEILEYILGNTAQSPQIRN